METSSNWTEGQLIANRFRLERMLGEGGMGVVYRAIDTVKKQPCALKFLTNQRGALDITRFQREFRSAARLKHPNCVQAYELGQADGQWFFTMEYVEGSSLSREKWQNPDAAVDMGLQILAALDHVHARQIVHRDIKPQNILVTQHANGGKQFKLSDLGIAKQGGREDSLAVGQLIGSLRYISPEQTRGEPVDPRSDLYSLGMVLYELLAGQPPFQPAPGASGGAWLFLHREEPPLPLRAAAHVSVALEAVVMRLLEKDPDRRFPMAAEAFDALRATVENSSYAFGEVPPLERPSYLAAPRMVGREPELATLYDFVSRGLDLQAHQPQRTLFISGEAGVGKSRIAGQLLNLTERHRARLVVCTCRAEPGAPYEPLAPLLQYLWRRPAPAIAAPEVSLHGVTSANQPLTGVRDELNTLADSRTAATLNVNNRTVANTQTLVEDWAALIPNGATAAGYDDREGQQWRFHRKVADQLLLACGQQRTILLIEDAQWADTPTLALLGFLQRAVATSERERVKVPWVVVMTSRPTPSTTAMQEFKDLCADYGGLTELPLKALGPEASVGLVASMLSLPADAQIEHFTRALLARAEGNPLFLGQVLHALVAAKQLKRQTGRWNLNEVSVDSVLLPSTIRSAVGDRAARFSVGAQETLAAAAVIGRQFELILLQAVLDAEQWVVLDNIDELIRAGFVEELGEARFRFAHDRFREAIAERLSSEATRRLHLKVAAELEHELGRRSGVAADLAHHYAQASMPLKAYRYSVQAGDEAMNAYAFTKASDLYHSALNIAGSRGQRTDKSASNRLLQRHAEASLQAGRFEAAEASYGQRSARLTDPLAKAENLRMLADVEYRRGNAEQAGKLLEDVLRLLGFPVPDTGTRYWWGIARFSAAYFIRLVTPAWVWPATQTAEKAALGIIARVCIQLSEHYYFRQYSMAAFYQIAALAVSERIGAGAELSIATAQQGFLIASHGVRGLGFYFLDRGRRFAQETTPMVQAWEELLRGMVHGFLGDVNENIAGLLRSEELLAVCPETLRLRQTIFQRAEAHLVACQLKQVQALSGHILELAGDLKDERSRGWGLMLQGMVAFRQGHHDVAVTLLEKAPSACRLGGDRNNELVAMSRWAVALACQGQLDRAVEVALEAGNEFDRMQLRNPTSNCHGTLLLMAGLLYQRDGRWSPELARAVRRQTRAGAVYAFCVQYSRPLFELGRAFCLDARGDREAGTAHLATAIRHCEKLGLWGPLIDVHRLAAVYFAKQPAKVEYHLAEAQALLIKAAQGTPHGPFLAA